MPGGDINRNMGSPMNPEGLPHWTLKNLLARVLRDRLENGIPYLVGYFDKCCDGACRTTGEDPPVPVFENLLEDVASVETEGTFGGRIPDVVLHRRSLPARVIEIVNTSPITPEKLSDYRNAGVDVFVIHAHDLESVIGQLRPPRSTVLRAGLNGCRKAQQKRLQELMEALESTPDATFGVEQPEIRFDVPEEDLFKQISESGDRRNSSTTYISRDGFMLTREDVRPSSQKFVVGGSTVSKADLFSVIGHVKWMADINSLTDRVGDLLWEMLAKVRHANGAEKRVGQSVRPMAEYPGEDRIEWESARRPWGACCSTTNANSTRKGRWHA